MKTKDVLNLWSGWDSPDTFEVYEISQEGSRIASRNMTGLELMQSHFSERSLKRFGSYGKGPDGTWRHFIEVSAEQAETPCGASAGDRLPALKKREAEDETD